MRYLIDTTVLVPLFAGDEAPGVSLRELTPDGVAVSILTYLEAYEGVVEQPDPTDVRSRFYAFFQTVPILPVSIKVAHRCAELRSFLKRQGKKPRRRAFDLVIAATALEHGLVLVSHNTRDFGDVPGLSLWPMSR